MRQLLRKRCVPIRVWAVRGRRDALRFITRVTFTAAVDPLWHPDSCFFPLVRHQRSRRARTGWRLRPSDSSEASRLQCLTALLLLFLFFHPVCSALQRCRAVSRKVTLKRRGRPELRTKSHVASSLRVGRGADDSPLRSFSGELIKAKKKKPFNLPDTHNCLQQTAFQYCRLSGTQSRPQGRWNPDITHATFFIIILHTASCV